MFFFGSRRAMLFVRFWEVINEDKMATIKRLIRLLDWNNCFCVKLHVYLGNFDSESMSVSTQTWNIRSASERSIV